MSNSEKTMCSYMQQTPVHLCSMPWMVSDQRWLHAERDYKIETLRRQNSSAASWPSQLAAAMPITHAALAALASRAHALGVTHQQHCAKTGVSVQLYRARYTAQDFMLYECTCWLWHRKLRLEAMRLHRWNSSLWALSPSQF